MALLSLAGILLAWRYIPDVCYRQAIFQQLPHQTLPCSRVGFPLCSPAHCTYLRQILPSPLSAGHSHYRMHTVYCMYPGVRSPMVFQNVLATYICLIWTRVTAILWPTRYTWCPQHQVKTKDLQQKLLKQGKILADFHCLVLWQELFHTVTRL